MSYRWLIWVVYFVLWTTALVTPQPQELGHDILPPEAHLPISKGLHVVAYALFTVLCGWVPMPRGHRWWLLLFLSLHGMGTEFIQTFVPGRNGCWTDVGIDHIGIALGLLVSWKLWRGQPASAPAPPRHLTNKRPADVNALDSA